MNTTPIKTFPAPQVAEEGERPQIPLVEVESNQVGAIGYDEATQTLAVRFKRGTGHIYHYPDVTPETHAAFISAESVGTFFGKHIKQLPFKKYQPDAEQKAEA